MSRDQLPATVEDLTRIEDALGKKMQILNRMREMVYERINPETDIKDIRGTICRTKTFADKLFSLYGGVFEYVKDQDGRPLVKREVHRDELGEYYTYEAYGRYTPPFGLGDSVEASGMASQRDDFLGKTDGGYKPLKDINEVHVRQKALTECSKKCIFAGLGFSGAVSKDELEKLGVKVGDIKGYQGSGPGRKGGSMDNEENAASRANIETMCRQLFKQGWKLASTGKPADSAEKILEEITANPEKGWTGWRSFRAIAVTQLAKIEEHLKRAYDKWETSPEFGD